MEILSVSRRTIYRLLVAGELTAHNDMPGKNGIRISAKSLEKYLNKYELPQNFFEGKEVSGMGEKRKMISRGVRE